MMRVLLLAAALSLILAGCGPNRRIGLSGAAALRVEVEVYKGPVGQSPEIQAGELAAQLVEAARDTDNWVRGAEALYGQTKPQLGCTLIEYAEPGRAMKTWSGKPPASQTDPDCVPLRQAIEHGREIVATICDLHPYWIDKAIGETGGMFDDQTRRARYRDLCANYDVSVAQLAANSSRPGLPKLPVRTGIEEWTTATTMTATVTTRDPLAGTEIKTTTVEQSATKADMPKRRRLVPPVNRRTERKSLNGQVVHEEQIETSVTSNNYGGGTAADYFCDSIRPGDPTVLGGARVFTPTCSKQLGDNVDEYARRISLIAALMRAKATTVAEANLARQPESPNVRLLLGEFAFITGNAAGRIGAGVTVMQKVYAAQKQDWDRSHNLPIGDYLRGSSPSAFMQAFRWFDAALDRPAHTNILNLNDRMRAMDALTGDYYWQRVNEVFASGQGDVSMALIKDDLGNWNLKNFSNEPGKLLAAYRGGVNALIKAGVRLATKTTGLSGGQRLLGLADQLASGEDPDAPALAGLNIETLHARTLARLDAVKARHELRTAALDDRLKKAQTTADARRQDYATAKSTLDSSASEESLARLRLPGCAADQCAALNAAWVDARDRLSNAQTAEQRALDRRSTADADVEAIEAETKALPAAGAAAVALVLADHAEDLVALQSAIAGNAPPDTPKP